MEFCGRALKSFLVTLLVVASIFTAATSALAEISLTPDEQQMLNLLNQERRAHGLPALQIDERMTLIARRHSQEMIALNYFGHISPTYGNLINRIYSAGVTTWVVAGENLAGAPTVEIAHRALAQSPDHYRNMLESKYTHVGIGVIDGGPYGKMYTQDFIAYELSSMPGVISGGTARLVKNRAVAGSEAVRGIKESAAGKRLVKRFKKLRFRR